MYSSVHYCTVCRAVLDLSSPRGEMLFSLSLFRARPLGDGDLGEGVDWPDGPVCWRAGWVNGWTGHELAGGIGSLIAASGTIALRGCLGLCRLMVLKDY